MKSEVTKRYAEIRGQLEKLQKELAGLEEEIKAEVDKTGAVAGFGYIFHYVPGRRSTDHETAALKFGVDRALIDKWTTIPEPRTRWSDVTHEAIKEGLFDKAYLEEFTTQGPPVFKVEAM